MSPADAVRSCFRQYARFTGRASRSEYWWFYAFCCAAIFGAGFVAAAVLPDSLFILSLLVAMAGLMVPSLAVTVRRLHDSDLSGWWILIAIVPFGGMALLVMMLIPGTRGQNRYGPGSQTDDDPAAQAPIAQSQAGFRKTTIPAVRANDES